MAAGSIVAGEIVRKFGETTTLAALAGLIWASTAADRGNSVLYLAHLFDGSLYELDAGVFTPLASGPRILNHSSIAFVADAVPEPGTLTLFGLGLAGLGVARRKLAS